MDGSIGWWEEYQILRSKCKLDDTGSMRKLEKIKERNMTGGKEVDSKSLS